VNIAFGPVPSRRLDRSLGINNISPKICTYACVYCQLGRTLIIRFNHQAFYNRDEVVRAVRAKLVETRTRGELIDHLTFVPDGEPTLDLSLAAEISALRDSRIPIAAISNASLIWRENVRHALMGADWVSLKIDSVQSPPSLLKFNPQWLILPSPSGPQQKRECNLRKRTVSTMLTSYSKKSLTRLSTSLVTKAMPPSPAEIPSRIC
jgi:hypothetical protein